jgi:hypothetical protein
MNRIIAAGLAAVLAAVLVGCGSKENSADPPPATKKRPNASDLFDKKLPPRPKGSAGPG